MLTNHVDSAPTPTRRPENLPRITPEDLCKAKYRDGDQLCYTGWLLHIFLQDDDPFPQAYKQFRLKTMDVLYARHSDDHASDAVQRAGVFNEVAESLGYNQIPTEEWLSK